MQGGVVGMQGKAVGTQGVAIRMQWDVRGAGGCRTRRWVPGGHRRMQDAQVGARGAQGVAGGRRGMQ